MKHIRFFTLLVILTSLFISCDPLVDENEIDYESLLPSRFRKILMAIGIFQKANLKVL